MKKGLTKFALSVLIIVLTIAGIVYAVPCTDGDSPTGCVCGHTPNSALGYGQVVIGGATPSIISCNNIADGVCPEDFTDPSSGLSANCSNCPDPECTVNNSLNVGYVSGKVTDGSNSVVLGVTITGHPIKWNNNATLDRNTSTNDYGVYNSTAFLSGKYYFSASKKGYDTQLVEATIIRGQNKINLNFQLKNGTCYDDCTNSENRCSAACDGAMFNDTKTNCSFDSGSYGGIYVKDACNNQLKDSIVKLGKSGSDPNSTYFVKCCEDKPYLVHYVKAKSDSSSNKIANLVKTEKIAKRYGYPVRVVVAYWPKQTNKQT